MLPKHFYEKKATRAIPPRLGWMPPLGSGAYKIKAFEAGRFVVLERVKDYWAADLPVNVGQNNVDEIRYDYYRDQQVAFEAFKSGQIDYFTENSAKNWATNLRFSRPSRRQGDQAWRYRPEESDRCRPSSSIPGAPNSPIRACGRLSTLRLNFEWLNQNIFYGQYKRISSFFENTEMAANGLPQGKELEILEEVRAQVPPEVFTTEYKNPVNATPTDERNNVGRRLSCLQKPAGR